ncbi:response regulator transcription factor [Vagococcus carniphilus]|uniref:response regulator transcription factor n=1 Tax=Vagococcus carniphilus TaxID=218144 RepID=UPI00289262B7|nr:response regulator transcription factor [Vagococcus carniphilus]MDT2815310.1 response regulator transcription factor [Vagococcus carniphilus]
MATKVLLVEDELEIANLVELYLKNEGFEVVKCLDGLEAKEKIETEIFDIALLDIMLPGVDGLQLLALIREHDNYPVIMLTAKDDEIDKITGLSFGADDYITKPFKPLEVVARVKAQLRRFNQYNKNKEPESMTLSTKGLEMNVEKRIVTLNEEVIELTPKEFGILQLLLENKGAAMDSEVIFESVWKEDYYTSSNNTIMVHIRHLREKMNDAVEKPKYIKTVWGVGYKID